MHFRGKTSTSETMTETRIWAMYIMYDWKGRKRVGNDCQVKNRWKRSPEGAIHVSQTHRNDTELDVSGARGWEWHVFCGTHLCMLFILVLVSIHWFIHNCVNLRMNVTNARHFTILFDSRYLETGNTCPPPDIRQTGMKLMSRGPFVPRAIHSYSVTCTGVFFGRINRNLINCISFVVVERCAHNWRKYRTGWLCFRG